MRYAVRYFRNPEPGSSSPSIATLFHIVKQQAVPSSERVWRLVRAHATRHGWVAQGDQGTVHILEGEVRGARELLAVSVPDANQAVVCMKLLD